MRSPSASQLFLQPPFPVWSPSGSQPQKSESKVGSDGGAAGRKDRELDLRHAVSVSVFGESASGGSSRFLAIARNYA